MISDARGLPLTAENPEAVETFDKTINEFLASGRDTGPLLQTLDDTDPNMLMGVCLRGYLMKMANLQQWDEKSAVALERAEIYQYRAIQGNKCMSKLYQPGVLVILGKQQRYGMIFL